jgi:release factor glutamine methyltransferase
MTGSASFFTLSSQPSRREFAVSGSALWEWWKAAHIDAIAAAIPPVEVDWFLQELSDLDRLALRLESFKHRTEILLKLPFSDLRRLWQQRLQERVPVQYLIGTAPWRQFSLKVAPAVLIPRPETECLIDLALAAAKRVEGRGGERGKPIWADLGTGSGAISFVRVPGWSL